MTNLYANRFQKNEEFLESKIDINKLVETSLPPSSNNVLRLSEHLRDINSSTHKIVQAISFEPMLVAKILRMANSPLYCPERSISSIQVAVSALGNKTLFQIVMMELAASSFSKEIRNSPIANKIWEHSLAVAIMAREIGETLKVQGTEEAFTCGLLHDIGKILLLSHDFQTFTMLLGENDEEEMLVAEKRQYGYHHAEVGSLVARHWKLQEEICYTIHHHHNTSDSTNLSLITHIVELADVIANIKGYGLRQETTERLNKSKSLIKLRLKPEDVENIWNNVKDKIDETIKSSV